ncbi:hypothetical protein [Mycobacterium palustre]|uniref:Peptidase S1 domain-containing protein n=1 Tax=Mycobacterium palustre TaxID=153971 RepID=A0A1X1Z247_9MYCO|nr:hypothetical protein [Mycobacterium palustre]MCV7103411.1 hypothetical protein [Mycobacterium palustre]ORW17413.1 hypothetical protein AWC19_20955 [Mycobacterium palustre]
MTFRPPPVPQIVPMQVWLRTFRITAGNHSATCFVISRHDRQWLITAKHFIDDALPGGGTMTVHQHQNNLQEQIQPQRVPLTNPVLTLQFLRSATTNLWTNA